MFIIPLYFARYLYYLTILLLNCILPIKMLGAVIFSHYSHRLVLLVEISPNKSALLP